MVSKRGNIRHIEINVSNFERSKAFYQDFLSWVGYKRIVGGKDFAGWGNGEAEIFVTYLKRYKDSGFHRRQVGLNHVAFQAKSKADVDRLHSEFLVLRSIRCSMVGRRNIPSIGRATTRSISRTPIESSWNLSMEPDRSSRRDAGRTRLIDPSRHLLPRVLGEARWQRWHCEMVLDPDGLG